MTQTDNLRQIFDSVANEQCMLAIWEHNVPGALDELRVWADGRRLRVRVTDLRPKADFLSHEVEINGYCHTITIYERKR